MEFSERKWIDAIFTIDTQDAQTAHETLKLAVENLAALDEKSPASPVMTYTMQSVFAHLQPSILETDTARFMALKNAGMEIAHHIDAQNMQIRPYYHNRGHFLNVQLCGRMIDRMNMRFSTTLAPIDLACTAVTDLLHDLDHPGGGNTRNGTYKPMDLELLSLCHAMPFLRRHNVAAEDITHIVLAVEASDPNLPKEILHHAGKGSFPENWYGKIAVHTKATRDTLIDLTNRLSHDKKTLFMSQRLGDADLFASFGLGTESNKRESLKLHRENMMHGGPPICDNDGLPKAGGALFALAGIVGGHCSENGSGFTASFTTPGAQSLGNPALQDFQQQMEQILGLETSRKIVSPYIPGMAV